LVRRFEARLVSRFQQLKREIRKLFLEQAVLGPPEGPVKPFPIPVATPPTTVVGLAFEWEFLQDDAKVQAFKDWYAAQVTAQILFPSPDAEPGRPWTALYTDAAYRRGIINAFFASRRVASALVGDMTEEAFLRHSFAQGESTAKVRLLATRAYEGLAGITATVGTQLNRLLAQGLAEGRNPRQIARQMVETIDDIGIRRARTLARTEIIYAHAEGQLWAYEELGVEQLGIKAEWSTAGDDRVCPLCAAREGQVYKVSEAHGLIPLHPNCRCAWIPVVEDRN
jgi:SPP1 gp7 family putative phage head morphogenesis protein